MIGSLTERLFQLIIQILPGEIIDEVFEQFATTITHPFALADQLPQPDKKIRQIRLGNILHQITG